MQLHIGTNQTQSLIVEKQMYSLETVSYDPVVLLCSEISPCGKARHWIYCRSLSLGVVVMDCFLGYCILVQLDTCSILLLHWTSISKRPCTSVANLIVLKFLFWRRDWKNYFVKDKVNMRTTRTIYQGAFKIMSIRIMFHYDYIYYLSKFCPMQVTFRNCVSFLSIMKKILTQPVFVIVLLLYFLKISEFIGLGKCILVCPVKWKQVSQFWELFTEREDTVVL